MSKNSRIGATILSEQKQWIDEKIKINEFYNISHAVQRCIMISKRVYETGTNEEKTKFLHGVIRKNEKDNR